MLFDNVVSKFRYSKRKGDNKGRDNMNDITRVFLELDKTSVVFVASNLANLLHSPLGTLMYLVLCRMWSH